MEGCRPSQHFLDSTGWQNRRSMNNHSDPRDSASVTDASLTVILDVLMIGVQRMRDYSEHESDTERVK
jgi:hypothetical protein